MSKPAPAPAGERPHQWEIVVAATGQKVKRCANCLYTYAFGHDAPCPGDTPLVDLLRDAPCPLAAGPPLDGQLAPIGPPWLDRNAARSAMPIYHGGSHLVELLHEAMLALATHDSADPAFLAFREGFRAAWWATAAAITPAQAVRTLLAECAGIDLPLLGTIPAAAYRARRARAYAAMVEPKPANPARPGQPGRPLVDEP